MKVADDPFVIFQNLIGSSVANRRRAIVELGWKDEVRFADDPTFIGDARFSRVNLDDDPEMESILTLTLGIGRETSALIFKNSEGQWWRVGVFSISVEWSTDDAEHIFELRNIVDFDHKDIIIRSKGAGTGIQRAIDLSIYRLYQGRLYRTFGISEEFAFDKYSPSGDEMIEDERHEVFYPEIESGKDGYLVVRRSKQMVPVSEWELLPRAPKATSCLPYRWDPIKYQFVADRSVAVKFCR
ncbi:MAG: hypothetical protein ACRD4E_10265 [Bryobacteraceae bacterium]